MKTLRSLTNFFAATALALAAVAPGWAQAGMPAVDPAQPEPFILAQSGDCHAIGEQIAAQQGGELRRASAESRGGRTVCVIVVTVPGKDGQHPRRAEFVVPAN